MAGKNQTASEEIKVYRPNYRHELGFFRTWVVMFGNVLASRELIWQLFKRDFFAIYKKSFIGVTWIFLTPVVGIVSWVFLQMTGLLQPGDVGIPYPAYVLIGSTMWGLFLGFYEAAKGTLTTGQELIMQVNYPHEALLFKQIASQLATFVLAFAMNLAVLVAFGVFPSWQIVFFPFVILPIFFLAASIGLVVSMISVVAVDIDRIISISIGLLIWVTPVIYSDKVDSAVIQFLIKWNPLTYLVCSARDIVIYGRLYHPTGYFICAAASVLLFLISWRLFYVSEEKIVEKMI
ncbi:MAG: ABC transporter permease [Proteobacteria bacterium]|nr:ABC transporter permease [Pseudomonadota bacterium]